MRRGSYLRPRMTPTARAAKAVCDRWNEQYPPRTRVRLRRINGSRVVTRTRSSAFLLTTAEPVVLLDGIPGAQALSQLEVIELPAPSMTAWTAPSLEISEFPKCRVCGCTDDDCRQCIDRTGAPCSWVPEQGNEEGPICSACAEAPDDDLDDHLTPELRAELEAEG